MSEDIEVDIDEEMLGVLISLAKSRLESTTDESSMELFDEDEIKSMEDLQSYSGKVFVNSLIVHAITIAIADAERLQKGEGNEDEEILSDSVSSSAME